MVGLIRDRSGYRGIWVRALLVGYALAAVVISAVAVVIVGGTAALRDSAGLVGTALVALTTGLWAGAPAAHREELPLRERWATAGLATAAAGAGATALRLFGFVPGGALGRTGALLLVAAIPVYLLGLLIPVLLAAGERQEEHEEDDAATAWGALGALVGGLLSGVTVGVLLGGLLLVPWLGAGPVLLATSVLLLAPLVMDEGEEPDEDEVILYRAGTPFGTVQVTELSRDGEGQPERRLYVNGEEESAEMVRSGAPALAYIAAAETWLTSSTPRGSAMLFLGGGAYTLPRRLAERDPRARITVVELDPEVTRVAYQFFGARREHGITTVHGDARAFVDRAVGEGREYDRIYVDVYAGHESLPFSMVTQEAFLALRGLLRPGGVVAMNVIGTAGGVEGIRLWSVIRTFASVYPSVALYTHLGQDYPDRQNLLLAGAAEPDHRFADRAGLFDRWPREQWPGEHGTAVYRDLTALTPPSPPRRRGGEERPRAPTERSERSLFTGGDE